MKLSFQTFCLIFVVTFVHLVVITAFAPMTKSATDFFATLDVETILENGREDFSALQDTETLPSEPTESVAATSETSFLDADRGVEEEVASSLLPENVEPLKEETSTEPVVAVVKPVRGAVTDVRVLSDRITRPDLRISITTQGESETESKREPTEKKPRGEESEKVESTETDPVTPEAGGRLRIREIRPL